MDRQALAAFLRSRRERLVPHDVGLMPRGRRGRRTPGLRREEVAETAGMSVDYYERLEQGRARNPSAQVIEALASALRLSDPDRAHLAALAGHTIGRVRNPSTEIPPGVGMLLDRLGPIAGYVVDPRQNVLAWNRAAAALIAGLEAAPPAERTVFGLVNRPGGIRCQAPTPAASPSSTRRLSAPSGTERAAASAAVDGVPVAVERSCHVSDPGGFSDQVAAHLRTTLARHPDDAELRRVAERMIAHDPAFAASWRAQRVSTPNPVRKHLIHPIVGELWLDCQSLDIPDTELRLVLYSAESNTESYQKLLQLTSDG